MDQFIEEYLGKIVGFAALWLTNWLLVMSIIQPLALKFIAKPSKQSTPGIATSAPSHHYLWPKIICALVTSLFATIYLWHLGQAGYFGRDFWFNNWLAKKVDF